MPQPTGLTPEITASQTAPELSSNITSLSRILSSQPNPNPGWAAMRRYRQSA